MDTYRVFISYSHDDKEQVEKIVNVLDSNGLKPVWDQNFLYGQGFHEQIKITLPILVSLSPFITTCFQSRDGCIRRLAMQWP